MDNIDTFYYSLNGNKVEDEKLLQPITYILQVPEEAGLIRTKLIQAVNYWLNIPDDKVQAIIDIMKMLYSMNILIDDMQDSDLRRGIPVVHSVLGLANTVSAANYIMFVALERAVYLHPVAMKIYTEQLMELQRAQGIDISWKNNFICPNEADYKAMIEKKTGAVLNLAIRLMRLFSSCDEDFSALIAVLGLYFQIRDDYCNLCLSKHKVDKTTSYYKNLTEERFNIPIIHALTTHPNDKQIISILKMQAKNIEVKHHCIELLEKFGSFEYTRDMLNELDKTARTEINRLGGNPLLEKMLDELKIWEHRETFENLQTEVV